MGFLQAKIYPRLPVFAQNWAISVYGYMWRQRRFGGIYEQELRGFKEREGYTAQQWRDYQTVQWRKLLVHAFETVPFYRENYGNLGFTKAQFERFELEDISKLPYLTKDELRQFGTTSLLSTKREKGGQFFASSGSTGTPTQILFSHPFHQRWSAAFEARIRHWAGIDRYTSRGMIGGRRVLPDGMGHAPYYRFNFAEKQTYFSAYHIAPNTVADYLQGIYKHHVEYMTGYAMSNYFLAKMIKSGGFTAPKLKAVITSSEKLTPEMRDCFSSVYGCKTYDSYSGVEACGLISENEYGQLLVSPDAGIMEILTEHGTSCNFGETGEIVSTGLLNFDQPLIRYKIGDSVALAANQHTRCGRNMPVIEDIKGRIEDTIIGQDGRKMVRFHGVFVHLPKVIKGQVVQLSLKQFQINVEVFQPLTSMEKNTIHQRMASQLGEIELEIREVNEIPSGPNGKFKAVISHVKQNEIQA